MLLSHFVLWYVSRWQAVHVLDVFCWCQCALTSCASPGRECRVCSTRSRYILFSLAAFMRLPSLLPAACGATAALPPPDMSPQSVGQGRRGCVGLVSSEVNCCMW
jgi:hypothetical protein